MAEKLVPEPQPGRNLGGHRRRGEKWEMKKRRYICNEVEEAA